MTIKHVKLNIVTLIILTGFALSCQSTSKASSPTPAFPEAQGFGAYSQGGRGGEIFLITNTEDYGPDDRVIPGSLRQAVEAKGPRTVIFRVSGVIALKQRLNIKHPYITIAGQSAPGAGICLKDDQFSIGADHVIVRHIRSRLHWRLKVAKYPARENIFTDPDLSKGRMFGNRGEIRLKQWLLVGVLNL